MRLCIWDHRRRLGHGVWFGVWDIGNVIKRDTQDILSLKFMAGRRAIQLIFTCDLEAGLDSST